MVREGPEQANNMENSYNNGYGNMYNQRVHSSELLLEEQPKRRTDPTSTSSIRQVEPSGRYDSENGRAYNQVHG